MDGGLGLFGIGLFLLSIALLYARTAFGLAMLLLALSLASMGLAFSEWPRRREASLALGVVLLVTTLAASIAQVAWWVVLATALFGIAYIVLWAEFRFAYFEHVPQEAARPRSEGPRPRRRWRLR